MTLCSLCRLEVTVQDKPLLKSGVFYHRDCWESYEKELSFALKELENEEYKQNFIRQRLESMV